MLTWVPFPAITSRHLRLLAASLEAAPKPVRMGEAELIRGLQDRTHRLFEFDGGLVVVHEEAGRLVLDATACEELGKVWLLVPTLKRLAADYGCHAIKTTVFDERLARAIRKIGGRVESVDLVLSLAAGEGDE